MAARDTARDVPAERRHALILFAILIGTFVGTLQNSVANVALPALMEDLHVSLGSGVWVVTLYVLTFAVLMPTAGYLGDLYGQRRVYLAGMALFTAGSLGAGLAPSMPWLLAGRVLQGVGIASSVPGVMAIISRTFSPAERGRAMGFWALANGAGHALGPPFSGFLTQQLGWRAPFLAALPFCVLSLVLMGRWVPRDVPRASGGFDWAGAAALTAAVAGLMMALNRSVDWGWASPGALALWAGVVLSLLAFVAAERRVKQPFVDLTLFANSRFAAATAVIGIEFFCLFGLLLILPLFLIQVQGWDSQTAGLLILPLPLAMAVLAPPAGRLVDLRGSRWTCLPGMALVAASGLLLLRLHTGPWWGLVGGLLLMGVGMALIQSPVATAVTLIVQPEQVGVTTGLFHMVRFVSGALGSTIFGLIVAAAPGGVATGFPQSVWILAALAVLGVLAALRLPGRHS